MAVLDVITHDPERDEWALIVDFREWTDRDVRELQQKLNGYLAFALDRQMATMYPESTRETASHPN